MSISSIKPCEESPCLQLIRQYPTNPARLKIDMEGGTGALRNRTVNNKIQVWMPTGEDVGKCGIPKRVGGKLWGVRWNRTSMTANTQGINASGNGESQFRIDFEEPIDLMITAGSFNGSPGSNRFYTEWLKIITPVDEFIAGPGSTLATSATGYPANTWYADRNRGRSTFIWRNTQSVSMGWDGAAGLNSAISFLSPNYPEWIDPQCDIIPAICSGQQNLNLTLNAVDAGASGARVDPNVVDHVFVDITVDNITPDVVLQTPLNNCATNHLITVKRIDTRETSLLRIAGTGGIDGSREDYITLGVSTAFGINSGESASFVYHFDSTQTIGDVDGTTNQNLVSTAGKWRLI